jgi:hypothetical protein
VQTSSKFTEHAASNITASAKCTLLPPAVVKAVLMVGNIGRF